MTGAKYMVFVDGGGVPKKVHPSFTEAKEEAFRLAEKHPNRTVRVLRIVAEMAGEINVKGVDYE